MSLFGKTYVIGGMTKAVAECFERLTDAIAKRFQDHDKEIAELRAEIEKLKREPRQSFAQKLKGRT
jgi:cell division protein FtsB